MSAAGGEVAAKLDRVREWLTGSGYGAALFTSQPTRRAGRGGRRPGRAERGLLPHCFGRPAGSAARGQARRGLRGRGGHDHRDQARLAVGGRAAGRADRLPGRWVRRRVARARPGRPDRLPIYLGDEQKRQRDPGRSVLISITFCTLWVIFLFICLQGLAPASAITNNASNVLPYLAGTLGPKAFVDLVALAVIASFATTIQSQIVDGSRIMFGMGRDRTVPKQLGEVNRRFRTPVAGLVVMGVIPVIALILYLASDSLQRTIVYIDSTGGLLFAGYYVVISLYSIWYYRAVLFRDAREFLLGLLLPLVGAGTLVYVIIKSLPGTATPVKIIALVLFLVGIPLALLSKAITRAPFFATRRERYTEETPQPVGSGRP
jgi:Amino acid permease